ncbi:hypothetical protein CASFOL_018908 [Castilleja foliolosa]|uniref:Uncharacterized protein n=1 Tax=Castilleja foliolosa TaxID=1961234 RepID=A0ABD3D5X8_9LAMI
MVIINGSRKKWLIRAALLIILICFLLLIILGNWSNIMEILRGHQKLKLINFLSKRKVNKGNDPIHNSRKWITSSGTNGLLRTPI